MSTKATLTIIDNINDLAIHLYTEKRGTPTEIADDLDTIISNINPVGAERSLGEKLLRHFSDYELIDLKYVKLEMDAEFHYNIILRDNADECKMIVEVPYYMKHYNILSVDKLFDFIKKYSSRPIA